METGASLLAIRLAPWLLVEASEGNELQHTACGAFRQQQAGQTDEKLERRGGCLVYFQPTRDPNIKRISGNTSRMDCTACSMHTYM